MMAFCFHFSVIFTNPKSLNTNHEFKLYTYAFKVYYQRYLSKNFVGYTIISGYKTWRLIQRPVEKQFGQKHITYLLKC